ncbi:MAG: hypothetical protein PHT19_00885 [Methylococcus sp.]|nr:hypothetical protein [Methylococcus sp.]
MKDHRRARTGLALCFVIAAAQGTAALADWAGFAQYDAVAEAAIDAGVVSLDIRIRESAMPHLAQNLGTAGAQSIVPRLLHLQDERGHALESRLESLTPPQSHPDGTVEPAEEPYYEAKLRIATGIRPAALRFLPAENTAIGLVVSHRAVPVADLAALKGPARLTLDWNDPWHSRFDDPNRVRRHSQPRSFVYVEPYEVRHEVLLRLQDLTPNLNFKPKNPQNLDIGERESLRPVLGDFLRTRNPMRINGKIVEPQVDRVEFLNFGRQGMQKADAVEALYPGSALVGVILVYLTEAPAETVDLHWDLFGPGLDRRPITLYFGKESFEFDATPRDPLFQWSADEALGLLPEAEEPAPAAPPQEKIYTPDAAMRFVGAIAALAAVIVLARRRHYLAAGAGMAAALACLFYPNAYSWTAQPAARFEALPRAVVQTRLEALLHNVYRAYPLHGEEASYDRLAMSLDDPLLEDVYLRQRRAILARNQGLGGEGRVSRIEIPSDGLATARLGPSTFEVSGQWRAYGTVSHWGHSHDRNNLYAARMVIRIDKDGSWKIIAMELVEDQPAATRKPS